MSLEIFSRAELEVTTINVDEGGNKTYQTDFLLYYFQTMTTPGMSKRMLENCSNCPSSCSLSSLIE